MLIIPTSLDTAIMFELRQPLIWATIGPAGPAQSHDKDDVMTAVEAVMNQGLSGAEAYVLFFSQP
jgi:hypothetical protein